MVRVNIINPNHLADQHLIAEYDEILMLLGYVKRYPKPENIPEKYTLGKGHIKFFKNKLVYLKKRHESLKKEMRERGFKTEITIRLEEFKKELLNDWKPDNEAVEIIKDRIITKLKLKKDYYRYKGKKQSQDFFIEMIIKADY
jgi:deoxyribonuclease (pyrimidine dimer)